MDIKQKSSLIVSFIEVHFYTEKYADFFNYNDLGLPLAVAVDSDLCTLNDRGLEILSETYDMLCEELGADKNKEYTFLDEMLSEDED